MRKWKKGSAALLAVGALAAIAVGASLARPSAGTKAVAHSTCALSGRNNVKHVIYLQFDNTHYSRDATNVASDLEQMPHLLNFLTKNGTLFTNDHTILISHTAGGILSSLTGLYPDRQGQTVSNSYDYFNQTTHNPSFTSSFKYWTDPVDAVNDALPNMITDTGKTTPAPWVPFTRAGCDVGGVGTANIELENTSTAASGDMTKVFGTGSPEWNEAAADSQLAQTDFVGIAIHCSQDSSSKCNGNANARTDALPDEPGGYTGFKALYGTKYVNPAIADGSACVADTNGDPITDPVGNCGFPGFDGMFARNTLGYVAAMQEAGVPVTYGYISDAHDLHVPNLATDSYASSATGPGEITHGQQLKAYDDAFAAFFNDLEHHGINKDNTLFVITVDEGDHFAGGIGRPQPNASHLIYDHRTCTNLSACPTNQIGEVNANLKALTGASNYDIHFDDAPAVYVNGQPGRTDAGVRSLERNVGGLTSLDPYVRTGGVVQSVPLTQRLADPVEMKALHMINADPNRTPTFTMFGNPDFFFQTSAPCGTTANPIQVCVVPGFAWNHGDFQDEIGSTWVGIVGPGVNGNNSGENNDNNDSNGNGNNHSKNLRSDRGSGNGIDSTTWTDHTNLRPTILALAGLKDDYVSDGHVLVEALNKNALPKALAGSKVPALEAAYEQLNASFGAFAMDTLKSSTKALESNDAGDATYTSIENSIADLTTQRDALASTIRQAFNDAAFNGTTITTAQATTWINQANALIAQAHVLPGV